MVVLGLDLASKLSGYCVGDGSEVPTAGAWRFPPVTDEDGGADYGLLLASLEENLDVTFQRFPDIGAAGYEAPILITKRAGGRQFTDKLSTLRLLYPLGAFTELYCRRRGIPCSEILVTEVKAELTQNPYAEKEQLAQIAERVGVELPKVGRLDAGDAFACWKRLLRHYDPPTSARWDSKIYGSQGGLL